MDSIGAFEAKTHFSALLERVARGERITITKRGVPTALLVPIEDRQKEAAAQAARRIRALRKRVKPGKMSIREMIDEGRRF
jgi:prevent-host-death family protein